MGKGTRYCCVKGIGPDQPIHPYSVFYIYTVYMVLTKNC